MHICSWLGSYASTCVGFGADLLRLRGALLVVQVGLFSPCLSYVLACFECLFHSHLTEPVYLFITPSM